MPVPVGSVLLHRASARRAEWPAVLAEEDLVRLAGLGEREDLRKDLDVVLEKRAWFDVPSFRGFGTDTMYVFTFRDQQGNALVWKTGKGLIYEAGTQVHLTGTIKDHSEYKDEKQTVLTRCKVTAGE